jgi:hypothetical protein
MMVHLGRKKLFILLTIIFTLLLSNAAVVNAAYTINSAVFTKTADNANVSVAYGDYANAMFAKSGPLFNYLAVINNGKAKLNVPIYGVKDNTGRIFTYSDYANAMFALPAGSKTINNAFAALPDSKALNDTAIAALKTPVISGSTLTLDDYTKHVPIINGLNATIGGNTKSASVGSGFTGTLDLSSESDDALVTGGEMAAGNKNAALQITSMMGQTGTDGLAILVAAGKPTTQDVSMDVPTALNLISYLGELDPSGDGAPLYYLRSIFGKSITIKGVLTDKSKSTNLSFVTLTIKLLN